MKRFSLLFMMLMSVTTMAQTNEDYERRYNYLASKYGSAGPGIEMLLSQWEKADSTDDVFLSAKFDFYFTKAQSQSVVEKKTKKYLGSDPVLTLKDSSGNPVYYFQELTFDDDLYRQALDVLKKAEALYPDRLDFRFMEANAYILYEKESPDMALAHLLKLADEDAERNPQWVYGTEKIEEGGFADLMLEYCYHFYTIANTNSYVAFKTLSEHMYELYPDHYEYLNNVGSYYLVAEEDSKTALKYYSKVLKMNPEDTAALTNSVVAYRKLGKEKQAKKCLQKLNEIRAGANSSAE